MLLCLVPLSTACQPHPPVRTRTDAGASTDARSPAPAPPRPGAAAEDPCADLTAEQRAVVVARIENETLTLCDFARRIHSQNPYLRARFNAPEQRRNLLDSWVSTELLAAEARARHLDQAPEVRRAIALQAARRLEVTTRSAVAQPAVTDDEVRAYFEAHRAEYETPAQVRASQIVLSTRAEAERVLADAQAHAADDAYFRQLVQRSSLDLGSRQLDGDLGFFGSAGSDSVAPEVAAAVFPLTTTGQIVDHVVESAHGGPRGAAGFHIVRMTARREPQRRTLDDESRRIRTRLERDKLDQAQDAAMTALLARLRAATPVQIDEAALSQVHVDAPPPGAAVPPVPGLVVPPPPPTH